MPPRPTHSTESTESDVTDAPPAPTRAPAPRGGRPRALQRAVTLTLGAVLAAGTLAACDDASPATPPGSTAATLSPAEAAHSSEAMRERTEQIGFDLLGQVDPSRPLVDLPADRDALPRSWWGARIDGGGRSAPSWRWSYRVYLPSDVGAAVRPSPTPTGGARDEDGTGDGSEAAAVAQRMGLSLVRAGWTPAKADRQIATVHLGFTYSDDLGSGWYVEITYPRSGPPAPQYVDIGVISPTELGR